MGNCLVTKLKGVVVNDNLPKYGELLWRVPNNTVINWTINIGSFKNCTIEVTGGLSIWGYQNTTNYGQTYHYEGQSSQDPFAVRVKGSGGDISLTNKYDIFDNPKYFISPLYDTIDDNDIKSLKYWWKGKNLNFDVFGGKSHSQRRYVERAGTLNDIVEIGVPFVRLDIGYSNNITGNLSVIAAFKDTLVEFSGHGAPISGSIEDLGECTLLNIYNLYNGRNITNISGTVEGFVARQRAAGRTTAKFEVFNIDKTNVTFNGHTVTTSNGGLSWTADTITCYGETINT